MTYFLCDIEILCVQNNKAHFLFHIKLNGHLTYNKKVGNEGTRSGREEGEREEMFRRFNDVSRSPFTSKVVKLGWMRIV